MSSSFSSFRLYAQVTPQNSQVSFQLIFGSLSFVSQRRKRDIISMQILTNKTSCAPFPDQACSGHYTARLSSESGSGSWARYHFSILGPVQDISQGRPKSLFDKIPPFRRMITSPFNVDYAMVGCLWKSSSHILGLVIILFSGSSELRLATNDDTKHVAAKTTLKVTLLSP